MSDDSPTSGRQTANAYETVANGARGKAAQAAATAEQLRADAGRAPRGVDPSALRSEASKWNIVAALRAAYAGHMSNRAANIK